MNQKHQLFSHQQQKEEMQKALRIKQDLLLIKISELFSKKGLRREDLLKELIESDEYTDLERDHEITPEWLSSSNLIGTVMDIKKFFEQSPSS